MENDSRATVEAGDTLAERTAGLAGVVSPAIVCLATVIRAALAVRLVPNGLFDDAYITLRYAANLANGLGFVYNRGEAVLGTTTPLFTVLLAAGARIFGAAHLEAVTLAVDIAAMSAMMVVMSVSLHRAGVHRALEWIYLLIVALLPSFLGTSVSGMETPVVLLWISLSLLFFVEQRFAWAGLACGLLLFTRIDGGIWTGVLGLHLLIECWPKKLGEVFKFSGAALMIALPWYVFSFLHFGVLIPQSVVGKAVSHGALRAPDAAYTIAYMSSFFAGLHLGIIAWVLAAVQVGFFAIGLRFLWSNYPRLRPMGTFVVCYAAVFYFARAPLFQHYFLPPKWAYYFVLICAAEDLRRRAARFLGERLAGQWAWALAGILVAIVGGVRLRSDILTDRMNLWAEVSEWIEKDTRPDATVFLEHIGLVGYNTNRFIYDSMGLVTPRTVRIKRAYGENWLPEATRQFNADLVLVYPEENGVLQQAPVASWFCGAYELVREFRKQDAIVMVYARKDSAAVLAAARPQR